MSLQRAISRATARTSLIPTRIEAATLFTTSSDNFNSGGGGSGLHNANTLVTVADFHISFLNKNKDKEKKGHV
jgi:hypothetical protein